MISTSVALLTVLALPPRLADPFTPDATVSYGWPLSQVHSINLYNLHKPPQAGTYLSGNAANTFTNTIPLDCMDNGESETSAAGTCEYPLVNGCSTPPDYASPCQVPEPNEVADWSSIYEVQFAISIDFYDKWDFPRARRDDFYYLTEGPDIPVPGSMQFQIREEMMVYLMSVLQGIFKVALRDVGVIPKIRHIHFMDTRDMIENPSMYQLWSEQLGFTKMEVMHFDLNSGNGPGNPCSNQHSYIGMNFDINPLDLDKRNGWFRGVAHELFHWLCNAKHAQCYYFRGEPVEAWNDGECYTAGPSRCTTYERINVMSYSWTCYEPPRTKFPRIRLGPFFDVVDNVKVPGHYRRLARTHILHYGQCRECIDQVGEYDLLNAVDTDKDEYADAIDNCPTSYNNQQTDWDRDGKGDACDTGCAITKPKGSAWWLVAFALVLVWRRNDRRRHSRD